MVTHVSAPHRVVAAHRVTSRHAAVAVRRHRAAAAPVDVSRVLALLAVVLLALTSLIGLVVVAF